MKEIWKDVVGYEGLYQVSNLGRVKSFSRSTFMYKDFVRSVNKRILKLTPNCRYLMVSLCHISRCCNGRGKTAGGFILKYSKKTA